MAETFVEILRFSGTCYKAANYERLVELKNKYDPQNMFHKFA
jgi:FAD/FMN-containing dehydrogenase